MKLFEGKTPSERNKIIAVIVLGTLAVISLAYTFGGLLIPGRTTPSAVASLESPTPSVADGNVTVPGPEVSASQEKVYEEYAVTPVEFQSSRVNAPLSGRNIFAFYEPPDFTPTPTPVTAPSETPRPESPMTLTILSPSSTYAGSKDFRLEAVGDKFTPESRIIFNGNVLQTTYLDPTRLAATVPASLIARSGPGNVLVNTPDGKLYTYGLTFNVIQPPRPDFDYIGLIARQHYNNDTAYFQNKGRINDEPFTARLNDVVKGRFKVVSISAEEVEFVDVRLGFHHKLELLRPDESTSGSSSGIPFDNPSDSDNISPNPPGIPQGIPRAPTVRTINPTRRNINKAIEELKKKQDKQAQTDDSQPPEDDNEPPER